MKKPVTKYIEVPVEIITEKVLIKRKKKIVEVPVERIVEKPVEKIIEVKVEKIVEVCTSRVPLPPSAVKDTTPDYVKNRTSRSTTFCRSLRRFADSPVSSNPLLFVACSNVCAPTILHLLQRTISTRKYGSAQPKPPRDAPLRDPAPAASVERLDEQDQFAGTFTWVREPTFRSPPTFARVFSP